MPRKDGSWFWTVDKGKVIQTAEGKLAIISACYDMTSFVERHKKLEEKNMLSQATIDNIPGGYHRCSLEEGHPFLYISNRFLAILGWTREEIRTIFDNKFDNMLHPDDRNLSSDYVTRILDTRGHGSEKDQIYRLLGKDGYHWVTDATTLVKSGNQTFFQGNITDFTDFVKAKEKKEQEIELQREIIEGLGKEYFSVLAVELDKDRVLSYRESGENGKIISDFCRKCGNRWSKIIPSYAEMMVSDNTNGEFENQLGLETLRSQEKDYSMTYEFKSGTEIIYHQVRVAYVKKKDGARVAVVGTRNIDSLIKKERMQEEKLKKAYVAAENANKAKTEFLNNMSHDIRTPMNVILGYNQLMKSQLTEPKQLDYQKKIEQSGKLLLSIINNVLDMARIESGKMKVDENYERVGEVVDEIISTFASEAEEKGIHLSGNMQVTHRNVLCDGTKIREIREHNTTTGKVGGTGLGMPIVKKMVDLLGGSIEVESELGKGTVFTVTLMHKMADKKYYSQKIETVIASDMGENLRGKHVLLAEDNDLNAEIAVTVLEETGLVIERVEDGIQCVNRVEQMPAGTYDMILMDIQMPNMDGYKATKCIRRLDDKKKAEIPIIAMTANAFAEDRKRAFDAGMNGHIAKPIDIEKLGAVIFSVLNKQEN